MSRLSTIFCRTNVSHSEEMSQLGDDVNMPQPLSKVKLGAGLAITPSAVQERPNLALAAMTVINIWSHYDFHLANAISSMMNSSVELIQTIFQDLKNEASRSVLINAVARHNLGQEDLRIFLAIDKFAKTWRKRRNIFVHHQWATCDLPDSIILINPKDLINSGIEWERAREVYQNSLIEWVENGVGGAPPSFPNQHFVNYQKASIWNKSDFDLTIERSQKALSLIGSFPSLISANKEVSRRTRARLLKDTDLSQAMKSEKC